MTKALPPAEISQLQAAVDVITKTSKATHFPLKGSTGLREYVEALEAAGKLISETMGRRLVLIGDAVIYFLTVPFGVDVDHEHLQWNRWMAGGEVSECLSQDLRQAVNFVDWLVWQCGAKKWSRDEFKIIDITK